MYSRCILTLSLACLPLTLGGQVPEAARTLGRLTVTGYFGSTSAGASNDLERFMLDNGYTDLLFDPNCNPAPSQSPCPPATPGPRSSTAGARVQVSLRYRLRAPLATELLVGQATAGKANGNRGGDRLSIRYDATMVAALVSAEAIVGTLRNHPVVVQAGAGPAFLSTKWEIRDDAGFDRQRTKTTSVGAVGNVTIVIPINRLMHFDFIGQYRLFGSTDVAPPSWSPGDRAASVSRSHGFAGLGVGVTF